MNIRELRAKWPAIEEISTGGNCTAYSIASTVHDRQYLIVDGEDASSPADTDTEADFAVYVISTGENVATDDQEDSYRLTVNEIDARLAAAFAHEPQESDADFLRSVAQNDYMIDGKYLPTGVRLNALADTLDNADLLNALREALEYINAKDPQNLYAGRIRAALARAGGLRELERLAAKARTFTDEQYGTDEQVAAMNAFGDQVERLLTGADFGRWYVYCLKATADEMLDYGLELVRKAAAR